VSDPRVLVGTETVDDAAVYALGDGQAVVQTMDFFAPVVDDPYTFGRIAAANSMSDIYAMGAKPLFALNIVAFPSRTVPMEVLGEILRGGAEMAAEADVPILGGHSIDDPEPKYGLCVTGIVRPEQVVTNASAKPGDRLVLTKPLGSGIMSHALKTDLATEADIARAVAVMTTLNRAGSEAMVAVGVHAATDVTGYGLLGHLRWIVRAANVRAVVRYSQVPVMEEALDLAAKGARTGGYARNKDYVDSIVSWADGLPELADQILYDPQTSGGLLIAVAPERAKALEEALRERGVEGAQEIGEIAPERVEGGAIRVEP
jgi:selenide,water dikinase